MEWNVQIETVMVWYGRIVDTNSIIDQEDQLLISVEMEGGSVGRGREKNVKCGGEGVLITIEWRDWGERGDVSSDGMVAFVWVVLCCVVVVLLMLRWVIEKGQCGVVVWLPWRWCGLIWLIDWMNVWRLIWLITGSMEERCASDVQLRMKERDEDRMRKELNWWEVWFG